MTGMIHTHSAHTEMFKKVGESDMHRLQTNPAKLHILCIHCIYTCSVNGCVLKKFMPQKISYVHGLCMILYTVSGGFLQHMQKHRFAILAIT